MKISIKLWMIILLALIVLPVGVQSVNAQNTKDKDKMSKKDDAGKKKTQSFELKANKIEGSRGDDPNIKDESFDNNKDEEVIAPKEKGGNESTRGSNGVCRVVLDNRTPLKIQIYVDGSFRGIMAPYGDSVTYTGAGETRVYARATFADGSGLNWGPSDYICYPGQTINFRMNP